MARHLLRCSAALAAGVFTAEGWAQLLQIALLVAVVHAAVRHASCGGISSGIAAEPAEQLFASGSSSSSRVSRAGQQQQQAPSPAGLAVPPLHARLLQQAPCLQGCLLFQEVTDAFLHQYEELNVALFTLFAQRCPQQLLQTAVPLLQVHIELAALQAGSISVDTQASTMALLACMCRALSDGSCASSGVRTPVAPAAATGASSSGARHAWLQPAQAAGLLQPVLHLLSGAVLHMLAAPGASAPHNTGVAALSELCTTVSMSGAYASRAVLCCAMPCCAVRAASHGCRSHCNGFGHCPCLLLPSQWSPSTWPSPSVSSRCARLQHWSSPSGGRQWRCRILARQTPCCRCCSWQRQWRQHARQPQSRSGCRKG